MMAYDGAVLSSRPALHVDPCIQYLHMRPSDGAVDNYRAPAQLQPDAGQKIEQARAKIGYLSCMIESGGADR